MEKASISDLENQLSAYLAKVRAGASVLILDRDQPVARLERAGIIRRGTGAVPASLLRRPAARPTRSLVQALIEARDEGR